MVANSRIKHSAMKPAFSDFEVRRPRSFILETLVVFSVLAIVAALVVPVSVDERTDAKPIGTVKLTFGGQPAATKAMAGTVSGKSADGAVVGPRMLLKAGKTAGTVAAGSMDSL